MGRVQYRRRPPGLTHREGHAARRHDLPVGVSDTAAGVLQVVQVYVDVSDVGHRDRLVRRRPGAAVVSSQQGGFHTDLPGPKPESPDITHVCKPANKHVKAAHAGHMWSTGPSWTVVNLHKSLRRVSLGLRDPTQVLMQVDCSLFC